MIQFIDLQTQYRLIQEEVEEAVLRVMRGGQYIMGGEVTELESALSHFAGVKHVVSCASGTDALVMALMAKGIGPGDAVFTPTFTFVATAEAIATVGATPIFVDIDPRTFNIDPDALMRAIAAVQQRDHSISPLPLGGKSNTERLICKAIIAVDLFGLTADYERIRAVAAEHGLIVVEDAAQSFGATAGGRRAGSLADVGCTSFFPAKPLGCYGDGGALFTDDTEYADVLRSVRVHGQGSNKYENVRIGITGRLDTIQAAVLLAKLKIFQQELLARDRVAKLYSRAIEREGLSLQPPEVPQGQTSAWAQYSVLAPNSAARERLIAALTEAGIPTNIYYPKPLHLQKAFAYLGYADGDFPTSEALSSRVFSLPMHPYLDDETITLIVNTLKAAD
jgi:dTDP-4-amino-4,6-dideoxygalactose transaminase